MNKVSVVLAAVSALLLSVGAFASENASSATGPGPQGVGSGAGEVGHPAWGNQCTFVYSIQKIGPAVAEEGEEFTYHVIVKNLGTCRLRHIDVREALPHGVEFVDAHPDASHQRDGRLIWEDVDLKPGRFKDFEVKARVSDRIRRPFYAMNTACAYTPWIGTQICDAVTTLLLPERRDDDKSRQD